MKVTIPDELKKDIPQNGWGKILSATPIVMTVIATLLAGLATSEMTHAQYDRALGAQLQSKAGDQWGYFQAKKLRGAMQRNSLELLQATTDVHPLDNPALEKIPSPPAPALDANLQAALKAVEMEKPEAEITGSLKALDDKTLETALQAARDQARAFDVALAPANQVLAQLEKSLPVGDKSATRDLAAAKMRFSAMRYDAEAALNQNIGYLLELQVRKANISADRHHRRSQKFFFGMLAAQAGVIVSTFAMAARKRNLLWMVAATAGIVAVAFAIYVYLRV
jgi:ribosomal protein L12E/L44/L45/RPP1/RPP2